MELAIYSVIFVMVVKFIFDVVIYFITYLSNVISNVKIEKRVTKTAKELLGLPGDHKKIEKLILSVVDNYSYGYFDYSELLKEICVDRQLALSMFKIAMRSEDQRFRQIGIEGLKILNASSGMEPSVQFMRNGEIRGNVQSISANRQGGNRLESVKSSSEYDITKYTSTMDIFRSGKFSSSERAAEYRRRGKSPTGFIDGVYNDTHLESGVSYNDFNRDWDADE